jgi:hypothetical protein
LFAGEKAGENFRGIALTTDYRSVCSEVLTRHLNQRDTAKVFPGFLAGEQLKIIL